MAGGSWQEVRFENDRGPHSLGCRPTPLPNVMRGEVPHAARLLPTLPQPVTQPQPQPPQDAPALGDPAGDPPPPQACLLGDPAGDPPPPQACVVGGPAGLQPQPQQQPVTQHCRSRSRSSTRRQLLQPQTTTRR